MKVEGQNAAHSVDLLKQSRTDGESVVLMKLLNKCAEDISNETLDNKLQMETEKNSSKESVSVADTPKRASKKKSHDQTFLDAYLTALAMSEKVNILSQKTLRAIIKRAGEDAKHLDKLTKEIKALQDKLAESISLKELQDLISKINELIDQYNLAIIQHSTAEQTYLENKSALEALSRKITTLQNKYDNIKDKNSDEAKEVREELEVAVSKRAAVQREMISAQKLMEKAEEIVKDAVTQLDGLSAQYPDFAGKMDAMKAKMDLKSSIVEVSNELLHDLKEVQANIQRITDQIESKKADQKSISTSLTESAELVKEILTEASKADYRGLNEKEAAMLLDQVVDKYLSQTEKRDREEKEQAIKLDIQTDKKLEARSIVKG